MTGSISIRQLDWARKDVTLLRDEQQLEINTSGLRPTSQGIPASAANVTIFLVAYEDDEPVGCGGLRLLDSVGLRGQAEVKRMYVVPSRRKAGGADVEGTLSIAEYVLEALEKVAIEHNCMTLKLEASTKMIQARRFYEKHGYVSCEVFGAYVGNEYACCYEKHLA